MTDSTYQTTMIRPEAIEFAKNWIADLRSGNFEQGDGKLHKKYDGKEQFCCLGVACKRIFDEKLIPNFNHEIDSLHMYEIYGTFNSTHPYFNDSSASLLPESAFEFLFAKTGDMAADPRIFLNESEYKKFQESELGKTEVPLDKTRGSETGYLWEHGYYRPALDGIRDEGTYEFSLMSLNDSGVPFTVIADMIEKFMLPATN